MRRTHSYKLKSPAKPEMPQPLAYNTINPATAELGQLAHHDLVTCRPRLQPEVISFNDSVHCIFGVSLANCHILVGDEGLIVVDCGHSAEEGRLLRQLIRE